MKCVKGKTKFGIHYFKMDDVNIEGFSESDWGSNIDDRKSTLGNYFTLGSRFVTWSSKKKTTVALSSTEVEYITLISASTQALWLRKVLEELDAKKIGPTYLYCDNQSAIKLAQNLVHHSRSKYFNTLDNIADHFTKGVAKA